MTALAAQDKVPLAPTAGLAVTVYWRGAEQVAVAPAPPWQLQLNVFAVAVTGLAAPALHRFALGAIKVATLVAVPQTLVTARHCAYSLVSAFTVNVAPATYAVPVPSARVFQPLKRLLILARGVAGALSSTVAVAPRAYPLLSSGTLPLVLPLPS